VGRPPRGKDADGVGRTRDFGLPNHKKIRPGAEIDEGRRPWEIKGIPPGSEVPKWALTVLQLLFQPAVDTVTPPRGVAVPALFHTAVEQHLFKKS
jgi:hypothetical protein